MLVIRPRVWPMLGVPREKILYSPSMHKLNFLAELNYNAAFIDYYVQDGRCRQTS